MKYLLNYAHGSHHQAQDLNTRSGLEFGFDKVIDCNYSEIEDEFLRKYIHILKSKRGAGYWLWKPYLILKFLKRLKVGDYLFYSDSGALFIHEIEPLIALNEDIVLFHHADPNFNKAELVWTKRDAFILMDCDTPEFSGTYQLNAAFQMYKVCQSSIDFVTQYLEYCQDERIITDQPNVMGKDDYVGFKDHRHDQSVLSLLAKKWGLPTFRDPSQFGNTCIQEGEYPQLINHTRNHK